MPKQGELLFEGTGAGNQFANPMGKERRTDFDRINPATNWREQIRAGGSESSHSGVKG